MILNIPEGTEADREVLRAVFLARLDLRKLSPEAAAQEASDEWARNVAWFESNSTARGSFIWFCDVLDLDAAAVRDVISGK